MMSTYSPQIAIRSKSSCVLGSGLGTLVWLAFMAAPAFATDLTGLVLDSNGKPVPHVPVTLSTSEMMSTATVILGETKADGAGSFRITVPDRWFDRPIYWRQELSLLARTSDRGNGGVVVHRELPLPRQQLTIQLERWTKRKITLRSADSKPLAGVPVRLAGLQLPAIFPRRFSNTNARLLATIPSDLQSAGTTDKSGGAELLLPAIVSVAAMEAEIEKNVFVNWTVYSSSSSVPKDWSETLQTPALRRVPLQVTFPGSDPSELKLSVKAMPRVSYGATTTVRHAVDLDAAGKATAVIQDEAILILRNLSEKPTRMHLNPGSFVDSTSLEALQISFGKGVRVTGRAVSTEGEPAASIRLAAISNQTMRNVSTDTHGRFDREEWLTTGQDGTFAIRNLDPTAQPLFNTRHANLVHKTWASEIWRLSARRMRSMGPARCAKPEASNNKVHTASRCHLKSRSDGRA